LVLASKLSVRKINQFEMVQKFFILLAVLPLVLAQLGERCVTSDNPANPNFIPHPTNCSKFLSCGSGVFVEMECPARLHFSSEKKMCDWPSQAGCIRTNSHQLTPVADLIEISSIAMPGMKCLPSPIRNRPLVAPFTGDCKHFLICAGIWTLMNCPRGLYFSVETNHCEFPENAKCCPTCLPSCSQEGLRLPNPNDCHKYFICNNGTLVDLSCANEMVFNPNKNECVPGSSCNSVTLPPIDVNLPNCPVDGALYPNYQNCEKFFICNGGTLVEQKCPPRKFFSVSHNNCQYKTFAVCASDLLA
jgi:hypothetical protein